MHDFASLRDRVELWKREQEAWEAIERKGESMLHLIAAAELALEEGNPKRAGQLVGMVKEDLGDATAEDWEEDEDSETLEDGEMDGGEVDGGEMEADGSPVPEDTPAKSIFSDRRDLADQRESQEDDELDRHVEAQIEKVGYESDAILDGSGIAGKIIREKYEEIRGLIDRAETADKVGKFRESERLLQEAEDLL